MKISETSENRAKFNLWFARILTDLAKDPHAGFATMMVVLPLLERYLREKTLSFEERNLTPTFHKELASCFPNLQDESRARDFWSVFRHGVLHQGTFRKLGGVADVSGKLANCADAVEVEGGGNFVVNPVKFAAVVVKLIEDDFVTFEGRGSPHHPLAHVAGNTTLTSALSTS